MARKFSVLELLARREVGLKHSQLIFVTEEGVVRAVFTSRSDMESAEFFADSLPDDHAVVIEDHTGIAWENEESARRQAEADDEEFDD